MVTALTWTELMTTVPPTTLKLNVSSIVVPLVFNGTALAWRGSGRIGQGSYQTGLKTITCIQALKFEKVIGAAGDPLMGWAVE
jgi:hypothetical protein